MTKIYAFASLLLFGVSPPATAQPPSSIKFHHLKAEQGLSHNNIYDVIQDRRGFIWIGTAAGLNRYDGYNFVHYYHDPSDSLSLSQNFPITLYQDRNGMLWIGTVEALDRLNPVTDKVRHFRPPDVSRFGVWAIYEDRFGFLWLGTIGHGLYRFDPVTESFTQFRHDPADPHSLSHNVVVALCEDLLGRLWVGTEGGGLNRLLTASQADAHKKTTPGEFHSLAKFTSYLHDPQNQTGLSSNVVRALHTDRDGAVWVGTFGGGLCKIVFEPATHNAKAASGTVAPNKPQDIDSVGARFIHYRHDPAVASSMSDDFVTDILQDREGLLWVGTLRGGLNCFDPATETFRSYKHEFGNPHSLSDNFVGALHEDDRGALWIATNSGGVDLYSKDTQGFSHLKKETGVANTLSGELAPSVFEDREGQIWIGTTNEGLDKYDVHTGRFTNYLLDSTATSSTQAAILMITQDRSGALWIGTWGSGLKKFDLQSKTVTTFVHDPHDPHSISENQINSIIQAKSGNLWITTQTGGLNEYVPATGKFTRYFHDPGDTLSIGSNTVYSLYEDKEGTLWIGTLGQGFYQLVEATAVDSPDKPNDSGQTRRQFRRFQHDPTNPNSLSHNASPSLLEDHNGIFWVVTWGGGLNKFDRKRNTFTHFTEADGLPSNFICRILEAEQGNLWMSTIRGLAKFNESGVDGTTRLCTSYDRSDGLAGNLFFGTPSASYRNKDGRMSFCGFNGITVFHPDDIRRNAPFPRVVLTGFKKFGKSVALDSSITEKKMIVLPYHENFVSLEFSALDYTPAARNRYAYRLEGLNQEWTYSGTDRIATYAELQPGEYRFHVKASNNDGVWNEEGAWIKIIINPPWWKTWWAYTLYAVLGLGLLYTIRRYEMNRLHLAHDLKLQRVEAQKLHEVDQIKSRFFANISHEFRTPLTLILGPLEQLLAKEFHGDPMQQYGFMHRSARRLLRLINQLLDLSKLEEGSMPLRARPENIIHLLKAIVASFASLAERRRILLRLNTSALPKLGGEIEPLIVYLDRDKFEKCMNNLLANAMKFTPAGGEVSVAVGNDQNGEERKGNGEGRWERGEARILPFADRLSPAAHHPSRSKFVQITVKDTGIGIPTDQLDKVFDRFYQVADEKPSPHTRKREGTGIGLALTKELIELHRGEICVESELGKGSTFIVHLPLGKDHLKPEEIFEEASELQSQIPIPSDAFSSEPPTISNRKRRARTKLPATGDQPIILIVEDNADMRSHLRDLLSQSHRIIEAGDGTEGLEKAAETIPDLIISDIMMPAMDGFAFCRGIKTDERTSHIPVILLTARASERSKLAGLETGADAYLTKPFNARELRVRVENLIEQRRKLRERFSREVTLQPKDIAITTADELFLQRVMAVVDVHISDPDFSVEAFAEEFRMSRVQLHRKIKALTDQSPGEFIRTVRLRTAAKLLEQDKYTVTEIAYEVGFNNLSYFAKCFREQFGVLPSEYSNRKSPRE